MEKRVKNIAIAVGILFFLIFMFPEKAFYITVFISGIICTIIFEIVMFYIYITKESDIPEPSVVSLYTPRPAPKAMPLEEILENARKNSGNSLSVSQPPLERRMSALPCVCNSPEFAMLCSGGEATISELIQYIKDLLQTEKIYGQAIVKLTEISFLDKIKKKKSVEIFGKLKEALNKIGKSHLDEAQYLNEGLLENLGFIEKDIKNKHKELEMKLKSSSASFESAVHNIQKLQTKLISAQSIYQKANNDYQDAKKDLVPFDALMKKEMKLKLTKNEVSTLQNTIKQLKENMEGESKIYLPKAQEILENLRHVKHQRAEQYRSNIQSWLGSFENCMRISMNLAQALQQPGDDAEQGETLPTLEETKTNKGSFIDKLTEKVLPNLDKSKKISIKGIWNKTINKKVDTIQEEFERLENKSKKIKKKINEIDMFVKHLSDAEMSYSNELMRVVQSWHELDDLGLGERWREVAKGVEQTIETIEKFAADIDAARLELKDFEKYILEYNDSLVIAKGYPELIESSQLKLKELYDNRDRFIESCRNKIVAALVLKCQDCLKSISSITQFMNEIDDVDISGDFSSRAKIHRYQCPFYIYEVENSENPVEAVPETVKIGDSESAFWFNDLLTTYLFEWAESPKFQAWICRRLKRVYNKGRPQYMGEIQVKGVELSGQAPEVKDFTPLAKKNDLDFFYEFDLWFRGEIRINLEFEVQLSLATVTVNVKAIFRSLYGRMILFYTPSDRGKSWYSFVAEPAYQIAIEPVLGKMNKVALSKFPQLNTFLVSILSKKIRKFVWPNKRSVKIPKGKKLPKKKPNNEAKK